MRFHFWCRDCRKWKRLKGRDECLLGGGGECEEEERKKEKKKEVEKEEEREREGMKRKKGD